MKENKICRICGREFYKKSKGRIRMTLKIEKGEKIIWICPECGAIGVKDRIRKTEYCPFCGEISLEPVEISYAAKLLFEELTSMHIFTRFKLKNKFE